MALGAYAGLAAHTLGAAGAIAAVGFTAVSAQMIAIHGTAIATGAGIAATGTAAGITATAAAPAAAGLGAVAPLAAPVTAVAGGAAIIGKGIKEKIGSKGGFLTDATKKVAGFARSGKIKAGLKGAFSKVKKMGSGLFDMKKCTPPGE